MLRAFNYPNYRLFFGGQIVSLIGSWISMTATSWLVYRLTDSAFLLGLVGFVSQGPVFLLAPFAGDVADRFDRGDRGDRGDRRGGRDFGRDSRPRPPRDAEATDATAKDGAGE